jgi:hypothetical protein
MTLIAVTIGTRTTTTMSSMAGGRAVTTSHIAERSSVMGSGDLQKIRAGQMDPDGEGMTKAGYVLGIVGTVIIGLTLLFLCVIFGFAGFAANNR